MSMFDFSKVEVTQSKSYVRPGMWKLTPTEVTFEQPDQGNPRLNVVFTTSNGAVLKERFILTPKALQRLKYLHEAAFGKTLDKAFTSVEQLGEYFKKALLGKPKEYMMIVGGEQTADGKIYARLPFLNFIVLREDLFEEGEFETGTARWKEVVKSRDGGPVISTDSAIIPDTSSSDSEDGDDMPW